MLKNRSVPTDTLIPHVTYRNLDEAIVWLSRIFGFEEHFRYGDAPDGAQLHLGNAWIMVHGEKPRSKSPGTLGYGTQSLTVFVEDVDSHFARTKSSGAKIVEELHETEYGERQYAVEDLEGHLWVFSRHARDVNPEEWGAKLAAK